MLTVATLEEELAEEIGPYLAICGMDAVPTPDGSNVSMRGPIRKAVARSGGTIAEYPFVTDADVATATADPERIALRARLYGLEKCWGNWAKFDQRDGDTEKKLRQLGEALEKRIKALKDELNEEEPGIDAPTGAEASDIGKIRAGTEWHSKFFGGRFFP
jgi:hypothetical protein